MPSPRGGGTQFASQPPGVQLNTCRHLTRLATKARMLSSTKGDAAGETLKDLATRHALEGFFRTRKLGSLDKLVRQKQRLAKASSARGA